METTNADAPELLLPDGTPSGVWMCPECRRLVNCSYQPVADGKGRTYTEAERDEFARKSAAACCREARCRCGAGLGRKHSAGGWTVCDACRRKDDAAAEARRFDKAAKLTPAEWPGTEMLYDAAAEKWFRDLDDAEEWYADDEERVRPAYLWCSEPVDWKPDASGYIGDRMHDHYHEDAGDDIGDAEWKRLDEFVDKWWEEQGVVSYEPDYTRCVVLPAETPEAA